MLCLSLNHSNLYNQIQYTISCVHSCITAAAAHERQPFYSYDYSLFIQTYPVNQARFYDVPGGTSLQYIRHSAHAVQQERSNTYCRTERNDFTLAFLPISC